MCVCVGPETLSKGSCAFRNAIPYHLTGNQRKNPRLHLNNGIFSSIFTIHILQQHSFVDAEYNSKVLPVGKKTYILSSLCFWTYFVGYYYRCHDRLEEFHTASMKKRILVLGTSGMVGRLLPRDARSIFPRFRSKLPITGWKKNELA